ncbi:hypothetical protein J3D47_004215 [Pseudomonas laurylsulfativorans]|nr:hypothetical protein [Pseudomonas laurylsulfativorans]
MPLTDAIMVLSETALRDYLEMGLVVALLVQLAPSGLLLRKGWGCSSNCCVEKSRFFDSLVSF